MEVGVLQTALELHTALARRHYVIPGLASEHDEPAGNTSAFNVLYSKCKFASIGIFVRFWCL